VRPFADVARTTSDDAQVMDASREHSRQRIVVAGGGIAGAEVALTLALGLPRADVVLIGRDAHVRLLPDLVYVPFGLDVRMLDIGLDALLPHGVHSVVAEIERVDVEARVVHTSAGPVDYDVLVAAPGARSRACAGRGLRSLEDALRIRGELAELVAAAADGERRSVVIRSGSEDAWTAPACEFAMLLGAYLRSLGLDERVETTLATADSDAFQWFGPVGETFVEAALRRARVRVATGVPAGRLDALDGELVIEFDSLEARHVDGLPGRTDAGWYHAAVDFMVAPGVYVIGDALELPYRAGFATAWQARRVLRSLGGDLRRIGEAVDRIPIGQAEYQMDLGDGVLRARVGDASVLAHPFLGHDADVRVEFGAQPDKLRGLVLHDRVLSHIASGDSPSLGFRDLLASVGRVA
jgi:hypothetical protein